MKNIGLIITLLVIAIMVAAITVKLATNDGNSTKNNSVYDESGVAGKLTEGMVGVTSANYDETITNSKGVVVIDYFAPTCSYCIKYTPIFSSVFEQYRDKAVFGKYDVTTDSAKISSLNIKGTPTTIIFKDGKEAERIGGFAEEAALKTKIDAVLSQK